MHYYVQFLVATFAFAHDYWQDKPEKRRHHTPLRTERLAISKSSDNARGLHARTREVSAITATTASAQECTFVVVFCSPLFCAGEHCADLCLIDVVVIFEGIGLYMGKFMRFFFLNGAQHRESVDGEKIACVVIRFSVATENRMVMHAIFSPIYGCPMSGTNF